MRKIFKEMEKLGVTAEIAREYVKYLDAKSEYAVKNVKSGDVTRVPTPLEVAYLTDNRMHLRCLPYLDLSQTDKVWGIRIGDVVWCRVHTAEMRLPQDVRDYFEVRGEFDACILRQDSNAYFNALMGFNKLVCSAPTRKDLRTSEQYADEFAEMIQIFRNYGVVAEDWIANKKYLDDASVFHLSEKPQRFVCRPIHRVDSSDSL